MKRFIVFNSFIIILWLLMSSPAQAEISWIDTEFDYSITHQSIFFYETNQYYNSYNEYIKKDDGSASYSDEAIIQVSEFQDVPQAGSGFQIDGLAKGPEGGVDPTNGILVQAFLSSTAEGLNDEQGVDISTLEALSRVVRKFGVDEPDTYTVNMVLTGLADFNSFYVSDQYQAWYTVETVVTLEELVGSGEDLVVTAVSGFPVVLDESSRTASVEVQLRSLDDEFQTVTYRVKTELILTTRIDNLAIQTWLVAGNVNGAYQVGSSQTPFKLQTIFNLGGSPDSDQDGVPDDIDNCPNDSNFDQLDSDGDELGDVCDGCPTDYLKTAPGICGCGVPDTDTDDDGTPDCNDGCPLDPQKIEPGICGCGVEELSDDSDQDGVADCIDAFPDDPNEWEDSDQDGIGNNADPDDDDDLLPDDWENQYGLDPLFDDADGDPDGDGWSNYEEFIYGTDPTDRASFLFLRPLPDILFMLLSDNSEPDCSVYMYNGCSIPPPSELSEEILNTAEGTYVDFSWSTARCAEGYLFAMDTDPNFIDDPDHASFTTVLQTYRANFSSASADTYYWAVASRCNRYTSEAGDWSEVRAFPFNLSP